MEKKKIKGKKMVVEDILSTRNVKKHAITMTLFAFLLGSIALWSSYIIFPAYISILVISFITIGCVPIIHKIFIDAEHIQEKITNRVVIHRELVKIFAFFFIGLVLCFVFWYLVMPAQPTNVCILPENCLNNLSRDLFFSEQIKTLQGIGALKNQLTGNAIGVIGACGKDPYCWFQVIFFNNLEIMLMAVIFSFLYGAGAIFLIAWNASIIGVLIAQNILATNHLGFLGLLPHGIPELVSYFAAAIAGGLLSVAVIKRRITKHTFKQVTEESLIFIFIAIISLVVGGVIEAYAIVRNDTIVTILATAYLLGLTVFMMHVSKKEKVEELPLRKYYPKYLQSNPVTKMQKK